MRKVSDLQIVVPVIQATENPAPMASAPPYIEIEQEAKCPICLEYLIDAMVLNCGHSFCQGCITKYCEKWEALGNLECPTCQERFQKGDFHRNWQLASLVDKIKPMLLSSRKEDFCLRHKEKLQLFCKEDEELVCFVCEHSPEHQEHTVLLLEQAAQQHKDKIINCLDTLRTEREKILVYVADTENESQEMLKIMESETQKRMAEFRTLHQFLKEQESHLLAQIDEVEKQIARKRDEHLARLSEELASLESLIWEMEEKYQQPANELLQDVRSTLQRYKKKETFQNRGAFPSKLKWRFWNCCSNSFLESAMKQIKAQQHAPAAAPSPPPPPLPAGEELKEEAGMKAEEEAGNISPLAPSTPASDTAVPSSELELPPDPEGGTLDTLLTPVTSLQRCCMSISTVTLEPATASSRLILSEDQKSMTWQNIAQDLLEDPEKNYGFVLGAEKFTAGYHFWEVFVGMGKDWAVGVARKPVKGRVPLTPEEGIWAVGRWKGQYKAFIKGTDPPLTLNGGLYCIRVCLNYSWGRMAFFDAHTATLLYEFTEASFSGETLHSFFAVYGDGKLWVYP